MTYTFLEPYTFKNGVTAKNRIVIPPMTEGSALYDGTVSQDELNSLAKRAGDAGIFISPVAYVTENGKILESATMIQENAQIGTNYQTTQKEFAGYEYVRMGTYSATPTGKVMEGLQHVIYIYREVQAPKFGSITVKYVDKNGQELPGGQESFVTKDEVKPDPEPTPIVHYGSVDVTYVDESGNPIPGGQTTVVKDNVPIGEKYTTDEKRFDGYVLVGLQKDSAPAKGTVIEGEQHVIYVYKKNKVNAPTPSKVIPPKINNRGNVTVKTTPSKIVSNQNASQLLKAGSQAVNPIVALCCLMMSLGVGFVTRMINKKSRGKY